MSSGIDFKDTNVANIGSKEDIAQRVAAAKHEHEWVGAGQKEGLEIWRIEKFNVKRIPVEDYGKFYNGDSYIILHTKKVENEFEWHVHFWLGKESSQDERATAAYKTVELDDLLGSRPVQHREVQGHESKLFLSYFPKGVKVLHGGVASGFHHVVPTPEKPHLYCFKGRTVVHCQPIHPVAATSLNHFDSYVLDIGHKLFVWRGKQSKHSERFAAVQFAELEERASAQTEILEDEGSDEFWSILSGSLSDVKTVDDSNEKLADQPVQLHKLIVSANNLDFEKVAEGLITRDMLKSEDVFVLNTGSLILVWVGAKSSPEERKRSFDTAAQYMQKNAISEDVPVECMAEDCESAAFEVYVKGA